MASPTSTPRDRFRARLAAGPLLADGGMGTLLFSRGIPQRACLDELVASRPELVGSLHREYLEAGAELIETVTFGANRHRLAAYGLADQAAALNRRAAQLAREARDVAGRDALVGGSIGPLGAPTRELASHDEAAVRAVFREQIDGLLEGGVDLLVIETFFDLGHALLALDEARRASDLPIVAEMTFGEELATLDGTTPEDAARLLAAAGADVVGVNCGVGPVACLEAVGRMANGTRTPRSIMPNAGLPQRIDGRFVYAAGPDYFGGIVGQMLDAGATIIGGCCGTTPDHVASMRAALDARLAGVAEPTVRRPADRTIAGPPAAADVPRTPRWMAIEALDAAAESPSPTGLARALAAGRYVVSVEIDPPRSIRIDRTIGAARVLQSAGVDVVNISDSAMARVRMGAFAVAFGIQHDLDLECMVHLTTRDRNLMALESELLGAHALGVRNIIALTGDPPRIGDYPTGTGVWDVDSIGLIEIISRLNRGEDQAGSPIGQAAAFTIACGFDPTSEDRAAEWTRLERKLEAGAHLVMTQPLYSLEQVETMLGEAGDRFGAGGFPIPVLLGILPLQSSRHAEFLHNEVPGITIPDSTRAALRDAGDRGAEVGLEQSIELLDAVGDGVAGTYVMPSFGRYEQAAELVRRIRSRRPVEAVEAAAEA
ncbi:MAG TPA: bifunctional homocysteine S-methyltransferase/methylenetetrahydrofolate reductase [Candidatus Limnocylindrales bacterium]|nr:bifunctional homocysteine S-methyltransferase/methylenetetrahydrofolate reductase [Candidatus Limnocylindrales bacterium]